MPCRSSRASISCLPRESFDRSRRPSGASGGAAGLPGFGAKAEGLGRGDAGLEVCISATEAAGFATLGFFRSGLTWRATLSQSVRSSSVRWRLRGPTDISGIENDGGRFMDGGPVAVGCGAELPAVVRQIGRAHV